MAIPVVVTGLAIGLAVAFYQENKRMGKPVPAEGAEGAVGGESKSETGETMALDDTGSPVAVKNTDAGPKVEDPQEEVDAKGPTEVGTAVAAGVGGLDISPIIADPARSSEIIKRAGERFGQGLASKWGAAKQPATTVQKPMPAHGGKGTGIRPIPIASMSTKGMSRMQASKNLGIWAGQNRLVR